MKEIILDAYNIDVIGFIKISKNVYKLKTNNGFYALKAINSQDIEVSYEHIRTLHLNCFVNIIENKFKKILTRYQGYYFYLMPWVENDNVLIKEIKLKYYFESLAYIHTNSFFNYNVNHDYFDKQINDISNIIEERLNYYDAIMSNYEVMEYRTPSGWIFVLNYCRIEDSLKRARRYLNEYKEYVYNNDNIRLCLIYNNFNYQHILMKQRCLISIDKVSINLCIYDIFNMYQQVPDLLFDLDSVSLYYLSKVNLLKEEKLLLACLLCIVPYIELEKDEIKNIVKMSRLLYYLDSISSLNEKLLID